MELRHALRTTGSIRHFTDQPVADADVADVLDDARFAPSGGNRQAWRVIVVKDRPLRALIAEAYLDAWHDYVAQLLAGLSPFSPLASEAERRDASRRRADAEAMSNPRGFPETLADVPVMLVVLADLRVLAATDRDLEHYQLVGGASVYPFVWSVLLAAHERGLGGVMTTVAIKNEPTLRVALGLPDEFAVAAVVALGYPATRRKTLTRRPVSDFAAIDHFDGPVFGT